MDVPGSAFAPLSRALVADPGRPRVAFNLSPTPNLPKLRWKPQPRPKQLVEPPLTSQRAGDEERSGMLRNLFRRTTRPADTVLTREPAGGLQSVPAKTVGASLQEHAASSRKDGDYLSAALLFALAGDQANAARCYQEAARRIRTGNQEEEQTSTD